MTKEPENISNSKITKVNQIEEEDVI